jgi:hypothetical protein
VGLDQLAQIGNPPGQAVELADQQGGSLVLSDLQQF